MTLYAKFFVKTDTTTSFAITTYIVKTHIKLRHKTQAHQRETSNNTITIVDSLKIIINAVT